MLQTISKNVENIAIKDIISAIEPTCKRSGSFYQTALSNTQAVNALFTNLEHTPSFDSAFFSAHYTKGETIVDGGKISGDIHQNKELDYSYVPLGFIVSGEVIVIKGGKATKRLTEGDFIGLFETSDWLLTGKKREIGDWTLVANANVHIIIFSAEALKSNSQQIQELKKYVVELARADNVPQPLTQLPLLDWVAEHTTTSRLHEYAIIVHTHLLPNNVPFFRHLSYLVGFGQITILAKPYSTVPTAYNALVQSGIEIVDIKMEPGMPYEYAARKSLDILWSKVIENQKKSGFRKLLIVDDGGDIWLSIPWQELEGVSIAGVEQTQRGITRIQDSHLRLPPVVSVASSGAKKVVESLFIGKSVVDKIQELKLITKEKKIGILGMGSIGSAAVEYLQKMGNAPYFYDPLFHANPSDSPFAQPSIDSLINESDIIIGTTGTDSLKGIAFERICGHKIFVSASSADVEFASILKFASPTHHPFSTREIQVHEHFTVEMLNGGYPINFDREKDATPSEDIVLTRALMYIGAMQAVALIEEGVEEGGIYELDRLSQKKLLEKWIKYKEDLSQRPVIQQKEIEGIVDSSSSAQGKNMPTIWEEE